MAKPVKHYGRWRIRWVDETGDRKSEVYDDYREAAHKLREHEVRVEEVRRGLRAPTPVDHTFDELADYWVKVRVPLKRSGTDDESIIRCHLRPEFGRLLVREVSVQRADAYVAARAKLNPKTVSNQLTLLTTMLNLAVDLGWLVKAPKIKKPRVSTFSKDFRYLRTKDEVQRVLDAARAEGEDVVTLYATAIFSGLRKGELARLHWSDVNFERRLVTVQRSFNGPAKSDRVRYVPILDPLLPFLRAWHERCPGLLVFPNHEGKAHDESARIFEEVLHRVLKASGFPFERKRGELKPYVTFHDLRHTFASHWVTNGGDMFRLQRILGHRTVEMTMRYAHLAPDAFSADYQRLG